MCVTNYIYVTLLVDKVVDVTISDDVDSRTDELLESDSLAQQTHSEQCGTDISPRKAVQTVMDCLDRAVSLCFAHRG